MSLDDKKLTEENQDPQVEKQAPPKQERLQIKLVKNQKKDTSIVTVNQETLFKMMAQCQRNQMILDKKVNMALEGLEAVLGNQQALEKKVLWIMASLGAELPKEVEEEVGPAKEKSKIITPGLIK